MANFDEFVSQIVSRAGILKSSTRRDIERELKTHFEDAMQERGSGEGDPLEIVRLRFGNPAEIARELEHVHRFERRAALTTNALGLIGVSIVVAAGIVLSLQLSIATWIGIPPTDAFPRLGGQVAGLVSLVLGYMSLYWEEWTAKRFRLWPAFLINAGIFASLFAVLSPLLHFRTIAPAIPFLAGALARMLQLTSLRMVWCLGTLAPTIVAALNGGRLLSTGGETGLWIAVLVRWIGLTAACYSLTLLSRIHARRFDSAFH